jgi:hypothetical protein
MKRVLASLALAVALAVVGCDDDDDYSYHSENCTSVDLGGGEEYELCCTLSCHGEYDYDHAHESCSEDYSCTSSDGGPCPPDVIDSHWYPGCIY